MTAHFLKKLIKINSTTTNGFISFHKIHIMKKNGRKKNPTKVFVDFIN